MSDRAESALKVLGCAQSLIIDIRCWVANGLSETALREIDKARADGWAELGWRAHCETFEHGRVSPALDTTAIINALRAENNWLRETQAGANDIRAESMWLRERMLLVRSLIFDGPDGVGHHEALRIIDAALSGEKGIVNNERHDGHQNRASASRPKRQSSEESLDSAI